MQYKSTAFFSSLEEKTEYMNTQFTFNPILISIRVLSAQFLQEIFVEVFQNCRLD